MSDPTEIVLNGTPTEFPRLDDLEKQVFAALYADYIGKGYAACQVVEMVASEINDMRKAIKALNAVFVLR